MSEYVTADNSLYKVVEKSKHEMVVKTVNGKYCVAPIGRFKPCSVETLKLDIEAERLTHTRLCLELASEKCDDLESVTDKLLHDMQTLHSRIDFKNDARAMNQIYNLNEMKKRYNKIVADRATETYWERRRSLKRNISITKDNKLRLKHFIELIEGDMI